MPQPEDEARLWATMGSPHAPSENEARSEAQQKALAARFPELVSARGTVDPLEALASVSDRVKELAERLEDVEGKA